MPTLSDSRALRFLVSLLFLAVAVSVPVRSQEAEASSVDSRVQHLGPAPSLFEADAENILLSYQEVLGARGLIDLLPEWCPGNHGLALEKESSSEWFCNDVPNPDGFPGGGSSYLRFFGDDHELFALIALFEDQDPHHLEIVQSQLLRSFRKLCPCRPGENGVTYCHCADLELRLMQQGKGLGLMVIDDVERFMQHTLGLEPRSRPLERAHKSDTAGGSQQN